MERIIPALFVALLAVAACNTVEGAGRDLQDAGQAISSEARETEAGL